MIIKKVGILDPEGKFPNPLNGKPYSPLYSHIADTGTPVLGKENPVKDGNILIHIKIVIDFLKCFNLIKQF